MHKKWLVHQHLLPRPSFKFCAGCGSDAVSKENRGGAGSASPDLGPPTVEFLMAALSNNVPEIKRHIAPGTDLE